MKPNLVSLRRNQEVWAVVEEVLSQNELLINFCGDLVRVSNQTGRTLRAGQRVKLQVTNVSPLEMRLITKITREDLASRGVDINI